MFLNKLNLKILTYFLSWRIATIIFTLFLINLVQVTININYSESLFLKLWGSWDGGHYIGIATNGYAYPQQFAFFPLYPILIKTLTIFGLNPYFSALLISNLACVGALLMFEKLAKFYSDSVEQIDKSILTLITFPTAFFFIAAYNESLLLFFTLAALVYAKKKQWFTAAICAGFATFTKFIAIALVILLVFELISQNKQFLKKGFNNFYPFIKSLIYLLTFGLFGIYLYSYYLYYRSGNPFLFIDIQSHWGRTTSLNNPITVLSDNVTKYVLPDGSFSLTIQSLEVLIIIICIILFPLITKRFGYMLGIYTLFLTIFTLFSGKADSSLRYILMAFPIFLLLGSWAQKSQFFYYSYIITCTMLQSLLLTLFLMGHWVG